MLPATFIASTLLSKQVHGSRNLQRLHEMIQDGADRAERKKRYDAQTNLAFSIEEKILANSETKLSLKRKLSASDSNDITVSLMLPFCI